ncbi:MAG: type II toxin-antitoxin system RelE/ParE family toxin [Nitrospira sp. CG24D]|nr:MAG: type II toxin-antitoxin system RelE/ParE family toxin [Nitrospira sp. CG24D]
MSYRLAIKPSASRELERLDNQVLRRADEAILKLAENPRPHGAKKLSGVPLYRIRVGSFRIVYEVNDAQHLVTVVTIGHRREVYRK